MPIIFGSVGAIPATSVPDGSNAAAMQGKANELVFSELRGKYSVANYRNRLFSSTAAAVTIPVVTTAVVSVFTLYNPPGSGVYAEMVETTIGQVLAATVVNTVGWYFNTAASTAAGTFTTKGTVQNNNVGGFAVGGVQFFSAYTSQAAITPTLIDIVGTYGATTNTNALPVQKLHDGKLNLLPGIAMHLLMSTAASTTAGVTVQATWAEFPFP
jgi:hypothetical protein